MSRGTNGFKRTFIKIEFLQWYRFPERFYHLIFKGQFTSAEIVRMYLHCTQFSTSMLLFCNSLQFNSNSALQKTKSIGIRFKKLKRLHTKYCCILKIYRIATDSVFGGKRTCLKLKRQIFFDMSKNDIYSIDTSF